MSDDYASEFIDKDTIAYASFLRSHGFQPGNAEQITKTLAKKIVESGLHKKADGDRVAEISVACCHYYFLHRHDILIRPSRIRFCESDFFYNDVFGGGYSRRDYPTEQEIVLIRNEKLKPSTWIPKYFPEQYSGSSPDTDLAKVSLVSEHLNAFRNCLMILSSESIPISRPSDLLDDEWYLVPCAFALVYDAFMALAEESNEYPDGSTVYKTAVRLTVPTREAYGYFFGNLPIPTYKIPIRLVRLHFKYSQVDMKSGRFLTRDEAERLYASSGCLGSFLLVVILTVIGAECLATYL